MPTVSIIIPVYKVEPYLRACVDSVLDQTYQDYEIILVDDGSPDNCPAICDEYAAAHDNIKVIHKTNDGLSSARNAGVDAARGKYIEFLDSDDTIEPETLETVVGIAENNNCDIVIFALHIYFSNDSPLQEFKCVPHKSAFYKDKKEIDGNFAYMCEHSQWNYAYDKLYRREIITANGVQADASFDRVCEDTAFLLDLYPYVKSICICDGVFYNYYIRSGQSIVTKFLSDRFDKSYRLWEKLKKITEEVDAEKNAQFIRRKYITIIADEYERMADSACSLGMRERFHHIRRLISVDNAAADFKVHAVHYVDEAISDYSRSTRVATKAFIRGNALLVWFMNAYILLVTRKQKRQSK